MPASCTGGVGEVGVHRRVDRACGAKEDHCQGEVEVHQWAESLHGAASVTRSHHAYR